MEDCQDSKMTGYNEYDSLCCCEICLTSQNLIVVRAIGTYIKTVSDCVLQDWW